MKMVSAKPESVAEAAPSRPVRVCIVEDDNVVREQLSHQLQRAHGFTFVSAHRSAEDALEEIPRHKPDVVLMDINLPKMSGIDCVRHLKGQLPGTQFVMLTVYEDADAIFKSLLAGAVGYLLKGRSATGDKVLEALRDAGRGTSCSIRRAAPVSAPRQILCCAPPFPADAPAAAADNRLARRSSHTTGGHGGRVRR